MKASMKHVLTKALGARDDVEFEVIDRELSHGDVFLLCSDGLTNMLPDQKILEIISTRGADLKVVCDELVTEANARGGRDNISVVVVRHDA